MATTAAIMQELTSGVEYGLPSVRPASSPSSNFQKEIDNVRDVFLRNLSGTICLKEISAKTLRKGNAECDTGETHFHIKQEFENIESAVCWSKIIARRLLNSLGGDAFGLPLLPTYPKVSYLRRGQTSYLHGAVRINLADELEIPLCDNKRKIPFDSPSFAEYFRDLAEKQTYVNLISTFCHEELHRLQDRIGLFTALEKKYYYSSAERGYHGKKQRNSDVKEGIVVESLPQFIGCLVQSKLFETMGLNRPGINEELRYKGDINNMVANSIFNMDGREEYDFIQSTNRLAILSRENIPAKELTDWASFLLRGNFDPKTNGNVTHGVGGAMAAIIHFCRGDPASTLKQLLKIGSYEQLVMETRDSLPYAISAIRDPNNWETGPS